MPSPKTPGSSNVDKFQSRDVDIGLHRILIGSTLPRLPQIRFTRGEDFGASVVRTLLRPVRLLAPLYGSDRTAPAIGDFYIWASDGSVTLPAARYDYNSDWTPLLAGLSPAGMAASLAAIEWRSQASDVLSLSREARLLAPTDAECRILENSAVPALLARTTHVLPSCYY